MYKVLVTRNIPRNAIDILQKKCQLEIYKSDEPIPPAILKEMIQNKEGIICLLSDKINNIVIDFAHNLKVISNFAVGYDNVDLKYATEKGIVVTNTPGVLTEATADLTWALILAVTRRVVEGDKMIRSGQFKGWGPLMLLGGDLLGKTLGIVGAGRIGTAVADRSMGWKMKVIYYDRNTNSYLEQKLDAKKVSLIKLLNESDVISIHLPLSRKTNHLFDGKMFEQIKPSAFLINTARGPIIDEQELVKVLQEKKIAGAGLDVYEFEPCVSEELLSMENVVLLPHIGSATKHTREKMARIAAENLLAVLEGKPPISIVNPEVLSRKNGA